MKRLWHLFIVGHEWKIKSAVAEAGNRVNLTDFTISCALSDDVRKLIYGCTLVYQECHCGAHRQFTLTGEHKDLTKQDAELEQLRRMI